MASHPQNSPFSPKRMKTSTSEFLTTQLTTQTPSMNFGGSGSVRHSSGSLNGDSIKIASLLNPSTSSHFEPSSTFAAPHPSGNFSPPSGNEYPPLPSSQNQRFLLPTPVSSSRDLISSYSSSLPKYSSGSVLPPIRQNFISSKDQSVPTGTVLSGEYIPVPQSSNPCDIPSTSVQQQQKLSPLSSSIQNNLVHSSPIIFETNPLSPPSTAPRPFRCNRCGKRYMTAAHLNRHEIIHTGVRPYECPYPDCNSRFSRHDNCMQHFRTHNNPQSKINKKMRREKRKKQQYPCLDP
ncbi:hypothetical protein DASC09_049910 [Saccharomycopsis crataegensis]|uniref:C2H2-type domain-containing protein n=1 Tax=Saccharomycopsis crataegensis TaxID=43959 RepID=A0AAV5QSY0_9ASCO|nr:hypothetical protein DASC09_049910 [Saccharomycopsis crataegensis]